MSPLTLRQRIKEPGVLKTSAQMMGAQSKCKRKLFAKWPAFVQRTLWHPDAEGFEKSWRALPEQERLEVAEQLKRQGNDLYRSGSHDSAVEKYSQAAGLFHYVLRTGKPLDSSVDDLYLQLVTEGGGAADSLRATCYANIAQCLLQKADHAGALCACNEALLLEPSSVKALYRRALAREGVGGREQLEAALRDLGSLEGDAAAQVAKQRINAELRRQAATYRRMFRGFLGRTPLGGGDREVQPDDAEDSVCRRLDDASRFRQACLSQGREADARAAENSIATCLARLEERESRGVDVLRPTPELKEEARRFGIDLDDPRERQRVDQMMWEVHRARDGPGEEEPRKAERGQAHRKTLMRDAAFILVLGLSALWLFVVVRWRD